MWKAIPDPKEAWEYLHAGLLYYGYPDKADEEMRHYGPQSYEAWERGGIREWEETIVAAPGNGFKPNYIYIEE